MSEPDRGLAVYAGGNIHTAGAQIVSGGSVEMTAKGDITLDSVTTGQSERIRWSSRNSRIDGSSRETSTTVSGAGTVTIEADGDITARGATLSAGDVLSVDAGGKLRMGPAHADRCGIGQYGDLAHAIGMESSMRNGATHKRSTGRRSTARTSC